MRPRVETTLIGYWRHVAAFSRTTASALVDETEFHYLPSSHRVRQAEAKLAAAVQAEGEIAVIEEFGVDGWQATN